MDERRRRDRASALPSSGTDRRVSSSWRRWRRRPSTSPSSSARPSGSRARPGYGRPVEPEVRWLLDELPGYWNWCRYTSIIGLMTWHEDFLIPIPSGRSRAGTSRRRARSCVSSCSSYIKEQIGDRPDLFEKLVPDYAPMVRRPVVDNGWYKALTRDNVDLVTSGIERITKKGIETSDGSIHEVDSHRLRDGLRGRSIPVARRLSRARGREPA